MAQRITQSRVDTRMWLEDDIFENIEGIVIAVVWVIAVVAGAALLFGIYGSF